jgi:hypothetical protein
VLVNESAAITARIAILEEVKIPFREDDVTTGAALYFLSMSY